MKYLLTIFFAAAALQVIYAEQDVAATWEQVQNSFKGIEDMMKKNFDPEQVKDEMAKMYKKVEEEATTMSKNIEQYMHDHPDSPVAQAKAKVDELVKEFKEKNPEVDANVQKVQQEMAHAGEKFAQQMKEVYEKMNAEGGIKDQLSQMMNTWGENMKKSAGDIEAKLKEMMQQSHH